MMRITFLTHYTELYGANKSLLDLIDGLGEHGVRAQVICPEQGDLIGVLARRGIPAAVIPIEWWVSTHPTLGGRLRRLGRNFAVLRSIENQIVRWKSDVVYTNSSVFPTGAMAAAHLGLPHVWHIREFGDRDYALQPDFGRYLLRRLIMTADATIFVSRALRRAYLGNKTPRNSHVIYNGVAREAVFEERRRAAEALRGRRQPFTFVLVGRFRLSKGQAVAIEAFARVVRQIPDVRLIFAGDAGGTGDQPYYDACRQLAAKSGVADRVEFWGYIADPERAYLAADVVLMCSLNEAMGRVTAEGMSACRPVIGYDSGGTSELIDPGRTGQLYRGNADTLAQCMFNYVHSPELAIQHGDAAWLDAKIRHSTESYAAQIYAILRSVLR